MKDGDIISELCWRTNEIRSDPEIGFAPFLVSEGETQTLLLLVTRQQTAHAGNPTGILYSPNLGQEKDGKVSRWAVQFQLFKANRLTRTFEPVGNSTGSIPCTSWKDANEIFGLLYVQLQEKRLMLANGQLGGASKPVSVQEEDVYKARLELLKDLYPRTARLLLKATEAAGLEEQLDLEKRAINELFVEHAALRGVIHQPTDDPDLILKYANAIRRFRQSRKTPQVNDIDEELALYWIKKGYNKMTANQLRIAVLEAKGKRLSVRTIEKRRERLGLVTLRKGRPPKMPYES